MALTYLQKPLLKPLIYNVLILSFAFFSISELDIKLDEMRNQLAQEQAQVEALYQETKDIVEKIVLVKRYDAHFKSLVAQKIVGEQFRADWIDNLMEAINRHGATRVSIDFSARTPVQNKLNTVVDAHLVRYEQIVFSANFQHEIDFIAFMDEIKDKVHELTLVQGCSMGSLVDAKNPLVDRLAHFKADTGNIRASCDFSFVEVNYQRLPVNQ
jgi:archaellum component FlaC